VRPPVDSSNRHRDTLAGYAACPHWRDIQAFLPTPFQLSAGQEPMEEWWPWRQHHVHLDCYRNATAPLKVILLHGVGTNGRQMSTILGAPLAKRGLETIAIDMPGYGMTRVGSGSPIQYQDWVEIASDLVNVELTRDDRPVVLYGLSAGGMETYHVAALNRRVKGIVGMTFLDQRVPRVRDETAKNLLTARVGIPFVHVLARTRLGNLKFPMAMAGKMSALVNDREALRVLLADRTSAGAWVSLKFLSTYMSYEPAIELEDFDVCPILLTQPAEDRWSPWELSELTLRRIGRVPVEVTILEGAGHYPLEEPGLGQMVDAVHKFCMNLLEVQV